jgi:hypothetical protein
MSSGQPTYAGQMMIRSIVGAVVFAIISRTALAQDLDPNPNMTTAPPATWRAERHSWSGMNVRTTRVPTIAG